MPDFGAESIGRKEAGRNLKMKTQFSNFVVQTRSADAGQEIEWHEYLNILQL